MGEVYVRRIKKITSWRTNQHYGKELKIANWLKLLDILQKLELLYNIQKHFLKEEEKMLKNKIGIRAKSQSLILFKKFVKGIDNI